MYVYTGFYTSEAVLAGIFVLHSWFIGNSVVVRDTNIVPGLVGNWETIHLAV